MRQKRELQSSLFSRRPRNEIARELEAVSQVLDANPEILALVYQDLVGLKSAATGRTGLTADQVLRCAFLKQYRQLTYEELALYLADSVSFQAFSRLAEEQYPSASTLQENIKTIQAATWEALHRLLVSYAAAAGMEKGRKIRLDATGVETNVHPPTDALLLQDGVGVITRLLVRGQELRPLPAYRFADHRRAVKKRVVRIRDAKKPQVRVQAYRELLPLAAQTRGYAVEAIAALSGFVGERLEMTFGAKALRDRLERAVGLLGRVEDQARRRVLQGEKVPAAEKVISFFECHTDIIEKGDREPLYGHKVFLTGGASGLILDCLVRRGNPADASMFMELLARQEEIYGRAPLKTAADGGFASKENLRRAKKQGVRDVAFSKRRGLSVLEMVKSLWVYKKLKNFRAGIEAAISTLKRAFGLSRCTWTGWEGFQQYVWSAVVSYNLAMLGRWKKAAV